MESTLSLDNPQETYAKTSKVIGAIALMLLASVAAIAINIAGTESTGPGGALYQLFVGDVITGPIGKAVSIAGIAYGGIKIFQNPILALFPIAGGVAVFKAEDIASSFGALI